MGSGPTAICWGGVYWTTRAFLPMLLKADRGFHHQHLLGQRLGEPRTLTPHTAYSAARFAVKGFTEALITDLRLNARTSPARSSCPAISARRSPPTRVASGRTARPPSKAPPNSPARAFRMKAGRRSGRLQRRADRRPHRRNRPPLRNRRAHQRRRGGEDHPRRREDRPAAHPRRRRRQGAGRGGAAAPETAYDPGFRHPSASRRGATANRTPPAADLSRRTQPADLDWSRSFSISSAPPSDPSIRPVRAKSRATASGLRPAGQRRVIAERILPHGVADELRQFRVQRAGDFRRADRYWFSLLPQPADA